MRHRVTHPVTTRGTGYLQRVYVNEQQEASPSGGAEAVEETRASSPPLHGLALWAVLVVALLLLALPVLWAIGILAALSPLAAGLPAWISWLVVATLVAVAATALWLAYRFAIRAA